MRTQPTVPEDKICLAGHVEDSKVGRFLEGTQLQGGEGGPHRVPSGAIRLTDRRRARTWRAGPRITQRGGQGRMHQAVRRSGVQQALNPATARRSPNPSVKTGQDGAVDRHGSKGVELSRRSHRLELHRDSVEGVVGGRGFGGVGGGGFEGVGGVGGGSGGGRGGKGIREAGRGGIGYNHW